MAGTEHTDTTVTTERKSAATASSAAIASHVGAATTASAPEEARTKSDVPAPADVSGAPKAEPPRKKKGVSSPMGKLKPFLRKRKAALAVAIGAAVVATLMGLVPYWIVYRVSVELSGSAAAPDFDKIVALALAALAAIAVKGVLTSLSVDWTHKAAYHVIYEVRMALADKLAKLPLGYFDRNDSGRIKHTMNEDVEQLEEGLAHLLPDIASSTALPILAFGIMFALDWRMGLAVLLFMLIMLVGYAFVNMYLKPIMSGYGKANAAISSAILTYVHGMKVIRAFSRSNQAFEAYAQAVRQFSEQSSAMEEKGMPAKTLAVVLSRTVLLILLPAGLWLFGKGEVDVPVMIFFILMSMGVGAALFKTLRSGGMTAFRIAGAVRNVTRLLEEKEIPAAANPQEPNGTDVRFSNVSFGYGEQRILDQVSFSVPTGTLTAIVGPSGAGKTTIARLLPRFWDADSGTIAIGETDVRAMTEERLMSLVSFVFQDAYLFQGTVMDNIRAGKPSASDEEVIGAARGMGCHDFIAALPQGYYTQVGEGGGALSGGQRQRIGLVRAMLKNAPIIVLDEATALVDPENEARIQDAISGLLRREAEAPKTIIAIAHRLGTIVHADQIVVMDEGRVAAIGRHEELLNDCPLYARMWQAYESGAEDLDKDGQERDTGAWGTGTDGQDRGTASLNAGIPETGVSENGASESEIAERTAGAAAVATTAGTETATIAAASKPTERETAAITGERTPHADMNGTAPAAAAEGTEQADAEDDPYTRLRDMSVLQQSLLIAGDKRPAIRKILLFSLLENVFAALGSIAVIVVLHHLIGRNESAAWQAVGLVAAMFVGQTVFYYMGNRLSFPLFGYFLTNIRLYLGRRLLRLPYGFFTVKDASLLESRIKSDTGTYIYVPSLVVMALKGMVIPPLTFAAMLWLDWRLALAALAGVPISIVATWLADRKFKSIMQQLTTARQEAGSRILEYIRGIAVIRSFSLAGARMRSYADTIGQYRDASIAINKGLTPYTALYSISFELGFAIVLIAGSQLASGGSLHPNTLMLFLVLAICFYDPLPLMDYAVFRRIGMTTIRNMNDIIQTSDIAVPPAELQRTPEGSTIELREVAFAYGDTPVLRNLTLTIPERGITALVGPSGGGKTTILNLIARFWDVQRGSVSIGGADVRQMNPDTLMDQLALVFQDVYLFNQSVADNIRYGNPQVSMEQIVEAAKAARCHEFIMKLPQGYDTAVGEGGGLLSGGQKQRISIARAILKDAPIILLDEATASIDPDNEQFIQEAFEELARNKTVVMIAHRLHTVRRADKIVVIDQGEIAQSGTHRELIGQPGIYRTFWEERSRAYGWSMQR